jgi:integrase
MKLAEEWGRIERGIKIKMLPGEPRRERVLTREEEKKYLEAAKEPLRSIAMVLVDSGVRPEESFRLRWENINWATGKSGTMLIPHGKTPSARRLLPLTPRVRFVLESIWNESGKLREGYVFSAPTKSGHVEPSTIRLQHRRAIKFAELRPFVLYTLRHTFLTRLGESGCDAWTLARIAGHSTISISARYVHPSDEAVLSAMSRVQISRRAEEAEEDASQTPS